MNLDIDDQNGGVISVDLNWDQLVATIALQIRQSLDLAIILQTTAEKVHQLLNCDRVLLYRFDADGSGGVVVEIVSDPQWSLLDRMVDDQCWESGWLEPYQEKQIRGSADVSAANLSPYHAEFLAKFEVKANLVAPVLCESRLWGLLIAHSCQAPRPWQAKEMEGLQQITVHLGIAIHQADLIAQLQSAKADLAAATHTQEREQANQQLFAKVEECKEVATALHQDNTSVSEARFKKLASTLPGILYTSIQRIDGSIEFTYANDFASELLEVDVDQILENSNIFFSMFHPDDMAGYMAVVEESLATMQPFRHEWRIITPSGKTKWIQVNSRPERLANQEAVWFGIVIDVTDFKQSALALQQSEARYRNMIETTMEGVWLLDAEGKTTFVNQRMADMLGYTAAEMADSTLMDLIAPSDLPQAHSYLQGRQQGIQEQHPFKFQRQDGTVLWALVSATPLLDYHGNFLGITSLLTDITELVTVQQALKTSQIQLSSLLDSSLDGIMAFRTVRDDEGMIIDFEWLLSNPAACQLVGRSLEELIGKRFLVEMPGNQVEGLFDQYVDVVESGKPYKGKLYYNHDGIESWFDNIAVKLEDGFAVTFRDMTAIKQSEQAIQQVNQQLEERVADLNQRHAEMLILSEISDFLQASLTVAEACNALTSLVKPLFSGCSGGLFITNPSRNRVEMLSFWGDSLQSLPDFHPQDCWALRRGRSHTCYHHQSGLRCHHIHQADEKIATTVCIPMIAQGETLGLFYLSSNNPTALLDAKRQIARTVAEQVALAIANLNLRETLQYQSIRDPLTGLFNRRYLEEVLTQEIARGQRQQNPIGVVMIDVDHFKRFNDTYGHEVGDYVLQTIGAILKESVRASDVPCRYGGEEITLILPECSLEQTTMKAEQIREAIAKLTLFYHGQQLGKVTISLGVAGFPKHGVTGTALIQVADAALYRAKAAGRNQVLVAP
ncbi:MAG TPA: diguanylate cyclase [Nodularia sp. (in: cyanobacteria)]|nr:diguanylate cyclase [Nodularia sp. (in: cyanobacteria)]